MWDQTFTAKTAQLHMNAFKKRTNANAYYSPGVDRFFAVDCLDPYTAVEIAQILSSKMPGIAVCILSDDTMFTNANCHEYTIKNKGGFNANSSILFNRQMPAIQKLPAGIVERVGALPIDYTDNENGKVFMQFKEYAKFVIQAWHSAKQSEIFYNYLPMQSYAEEFFTGMIPEDFLTPADSAIDTIGITRAIRRTLYHSNSSTDALNSIADIWRTNNDPNTVPWRGMFYRLLEIDPPADLTVNMDGFSGFLL